MIRLVALSFAGAVVFIGFSIPFLLAGFLGLMVGVITTIAGALLFWFTELKTKKSLHANTTWNRAMKSDGGNLIERGGAD